LAALRTQMFFPVPPRRELPPIPRLAISNPRRSGLMSLLISGAILVALTTPFCLTLLLFCWGILSACFGGYFADNSPGVLLLLTGTINVSLYLALCGVVLLIFRPRSLRWAQVAVVATTLVHLGFWLGWSLAIVHHMAETNSWL
jgi:hypothetical protein